MSAERLPAGVTTSDHQWERFERRVSHDRHKRLRVLVEGWDVKNGIRCGSCNTVLPLYKYYLNHKSVNGLTSFCKNCTKTIRFREKKRKREQKEAARLILESFESEIRRRTQAVSSHPTDH